MSDSSLRIFLEDLRFYSRIGVGEQERRVGNEYSVSVSVVYDATFFEEEDLETTISYADVYEEIKREMMRESLLLESVALRISERISKRWDIVDEISVVIVKIKPPVSGLCGQCGIEYLWKKS